MHPFIAVWDDHELTDGAWRDGAANHNPAQGEGDWATRRAAAYKAYLEWMPIREAAGGSIRLYRHFRFGSLLDLLMLDTRGLRDQQAATDDLEALADPNRTLLGAQQETWMFDTLRASQRADTTWRMLGQQVMFSPAVPPGRPVLSTDLWDGYRGARQRIFDFLAAEKIRDVAILSGDLHSSWAMDVAPDPWNAYDRSSGRGSVAVELLAPAISSPPLFANAQYRELMPLLRVFLPHVRFMDGDSRGYVVVDITRDRMRGEWYFTPTVLERTAEERRAAAFVCERGSAHLADA
jgi:alkaline phosphatase D